LARPPRAQEPGQWINLLQDHPGNTEGAIRDVRSRVDATTGEIDHPARRLSHHTRTNRPHADAYPGQCPASPANRTSQRQRVSDDIGQQRIARPDGQRQVVALRGDNALPDRPATDPLRINVVRLSLPTRLADPLL
jgi:hypothetical protein